MTKGPEVEYVICLLNLTYTLKGFDAIRDLKLWLDEHANDGWAHEDRPPGMPTTGEAVYAPVIR